MMYLLVLTNILALVLGQILFKIGLKHSGGLEINFQSLLKVLFTPQIFLGLTIYAFSVILWFYILSKYEISTVYPMQSLAYILMAIAAVAIFGEQIGPLKWIGILLIVGGVVLVTR